MSEQPTPDPLAFDTERARAIVAGKTAEQLLTWQQQLLGTVAMSEAQAARCGLRHLPGWHGCVGRPYLALIEERLNQPFPSPA